MNRAPLLARPRVERAQSARCASGWLSAAGLTRFVTRNPVRFDSEFLHLRVQSASADTECAGCCRSIAFQRAQCTGDVPCLRLLKPLAKFEGVFRLTAGVDQRLNGFDVRRGGLRSEVIAKGPGGGWRGVWLVQGLYFHTARLVQSLYRETGSRLAGVGSQCQGVLPTARASIAQTVGKTGFSRLAKRRGLRKRGARQEKGDTVRRLLRDGGKVRPRGRKSSLKME